MATLDTQLAGASRSAMAAVKNAESKPTAAPNGAPAAAPPAEVPEIAKKVSPKKTSPKPAAKKATDRTSIVEPPKKVVKAAKKPATPKPAPKRPGYSDDAIIKVLKSDHDLRGFRGDAVNALLKDGQTIGKFKASLEKQGGRLRTYYGWALRTALELKLIVVKQAKEATKA